MAAIVLGAAAVLPACAAQPLSLDRRAAIDGRVVDAGTGAPIEGAVVIATWRTELAPSPAAIALGLAVGGHGGSEQRVAYIREATTGPDGRFTIPAWSASEQWQGATVTSASPVITFYKPGYVPASIGLAMWRMGMSDSESDTGLRGPSLMALHRAGRQPKRDLPDFGTRRLTLEEEALRRVKDFNRALEGDAMEADAPGAPPSSAARERARNAQRTARALVTEDLRRASKEKP